MGAASTNGLTLRTAALIAGFAYLLGPVSYAEFTLYPKLIIAGNIEQTVANIAAHHGMYVAMFMCYFVNFIEDIVIAWALFYLLAPVNRAVSALASIFQLVYATLTLGAALNMATVYQMLTTSEYAKTFGPMQLHAQVGLLLHSFRYHYELGLVLFGIHLVLVGVLIVRSTYMPWWLGALLVIDGLGWIVTELQPYLFPAINVDALFITFLGELVFMLWLLIMGWRLREPVLTAPVPA